ncbi:peptidylprolyl isomerase [Prosthecobacter sp.]|uniref:peptidylprolyl isomerase n=1 Tax=Prosthecobacter sp. TaxID=1965333 RepID=UPI0037848E81
MKTYALLIPGLMLQLLVVCVRGAEPAGGKAADAKAKAADAKAKAADAKATAPAAANETVGERGSVKRLEFEGNVTFSTEKVRRSLRLQGDWMLAAHPAAPLEGYVKATREALLRGYQRAGFALAEVKETRWLENPPRLLCVISEGPRYTAGEVTVSGARTVPAALIVEKLTTREIPAPADVKLSFSATTGSSPSEGAAKSPDTSSALGPKKKIEWEKGKPAKMDETRRRELKEVVVKILEKAGLMQAQVKIEVERDDAAKTAALKVIIVSEGPSAVLNDIQVTGLKRDSRTALLKYLGLRTGLPFLSGQVQEIEKQLLESARYTSYKVKATPHKEGQAEMDLKLELVEMPEAPKLDVKLSQTHETLMKASAWVSEVLNSGREDLVVEVSDFSMAGGRMDVKVIYNALLGLQASVAVADDVEGKKNVRKYEVLYAREGLQALFSTHDGRTKQWLNQTVKTPAKGRLFVEIKTDEPKDGKTSGTLNFGGGLRQRDEEGDLRLLRFELGMTPAAALLRELRPGDGWLHKDGRLTLPDMELPGGDDFSFAIDEATGRPLLMKGGFWDKKHTTLKRYALRMEAGAWEKGLRELKKEAAGLPNSLVEGGALASWAGMAVAGYLQGDFGTKDAPVLTPEETARKIAAAQAVAEKVGASASVLWASVFGGPEGESFDVPDDPEKPRRDNEATSVMLAKMGILVVDSLAPEGSWPWLLAREVYYSTNGRNEYTGRILAQALEDPRLGPVGSYAASVLLDWTLPAEAGTFRNLAHAKLSAEDFRRDWGMLVENTTTEQRVAATNLLEKLRDGDAAVTGWLKDLNLTAGTGTKAAMPAVMEVFVAELRRDKERPLASALTAAMDRVWDEELGVKMRMLLAPKGRDGQPVDPATVAAVVGNVEISRQSLAEEMALQRMVFLAKPGATVARLNAQRAEMEERTLQRMIEMELYNAAWKAMGNFVKVEYGDKDLNDLIAQEFDGSQARLEELLKKEGTTLMAYRERLAKKAVALMMWNKIGEMAGVPTEEDIAKQMAVIKDRPEAQPERQVKLRTISMPKTTVERDAKEQKKLVDEVRAAAAAAKTAEEFGKLAKKHSTDSRAEDGGVMDWMPPALLSPAIGGQLAAMEPGGVSAVLDLGSVWLIVKYEEERLQPKSAADLRKAAMAAAKERKAEEFREQWLRNVRGKFKVEILPRADSMNREKDAGTKTKNTGC